jgi:hypothetical protein
MDETNRTGNDDAIDRRDELIGRVIDGEASERDWSSLRTLAQADPSVWTDLTATQRQHELLSDAVDEVGMLAEGVELPEGELMTPAERFERRMNGVRAWGGWAAAAAILLVWFTGLPAPMRNASPVRPANPTGTSSAGLVPRGLLPATPDEALAQYLDTGREAGRVIGVMPDKRVLESRPLADGSGVEVLFVRQILEREFVPADQVFKVGRDEFGAASIVPAPEQVPVKVSY